MILDKRAESIFDAVLDGFIKTGEPVSSGWLYETGRFDIKPAMIRHELESLTELGLLNQPYHSAGRIPSDRGIEFFAQKILEQELAGIVDDQIQKHFVDCNWSDFLGQFSAKLGLLGVIEVEEENRLYKTGLENLIDSLNLDDRSEIKSIIKDFEELDRRVEKIRDKIFDQNEIRIFIGEKSPVTDSQELAIVAERFARNGEDIFLMAIGPKRMNYKKVVKTFNGIKEINKQNARGK